MEKNVSLKIIFAGTPEFSVPTLQALMDSDHQVIAVLTQPDRHSGRGQHVHRSPVKKLAEKNNIPVLQPENLKDDAVKATLNNLQADVIVVVAYGIILSKDVLSIPKHGCLNVHASVLPCWRGAAPIHRAVLAGDKKSGITIMQMDEGLDTGDILAIKDREIAGDETTGDLHDALAVMGGGLLLNVLSQLESASLAPIKQDDSLATYAKKIEKSDGEIDWQQSAQQIYTQIRGCNPWPVAFTHLGDQVIRVWIAAVIDEKTNASPGTIIAENKDSIDVATGDGVLKLLEIQLPGSRRMSVLDVLNSKSDWFKEGAQLC